MKYSDIKFVKRLDKNGVTCGWFVCHKSNDGKDEEYMTEKQWDGEFPIEQLPESVQKFIADHSETYIDAEDEFVCTTIA